MSVDGKHKEIVRRLTQIKPNRRVNKTINKTYRLHQTDIWGALGRVSQDKKITKFVASANKSQLISQLRKYPRNISKQIKQRVLWGNKKATKNLFLYQLTQIPQRRKSIKKTLRTTVLKMRKKLLLFYFASRIRAKTFRRFSKLYMERAYSSLHNKIGKNNFISYVGYKNFTLFLEARLDVLFLRLSFLPTMYAIRQALLHRKGNVYGQTPLNQPGFLVKAYREFSGERDYLKFFDPHLLKNKQSLNKKYDHPVYIRPNHAIKRFFKLFEPLVQLIKYPFEKASPLVFKFSANKHNLFIFLLFAILNLD